MPTGDLHMLEHLAAARRARGLPETAEPYVASAPVQANHQLINASSGDVEIYTPPEIVEAWREVLGGFDTDPASSAAANERIRAAVYYTEGEYTAVGRMEHDGSPIRHYADWGGLSRPWMGRVPLNPPFGTPEAPCKPGCTKGKCSKRGWHTATALPGMQHWVGRFIGEHAVGHLTEGCMICFAATSEGWFKPLLALPQCFLHGRTHYMLPDGTRYQGATKGSVVTYIGPNVGRFAEVFSKLGTVKVPYAARG